MGPDFSALKSVESEGLEPPVAQEHFPKHSRKEMWDHLILTLQPSPGLDKTILFRDFPGRAILPPVAIPNACSNASHTSHPKVFSTSTLGLGHQNHTFKRINV